MKNVTIKKDKTNIICTYENEAGEMEEKIVPIYDENGKYNPELKEWLGISKASKTKEPVEKLEDPEELEEEIDDQEFETPKRRIKKETNDDKGFLEKANKNLLRVIIGAGSIVALVAVLRSCGLENSKKAPVTSGITTEATDDTKTTLEDLQNDSRYTEITEDMLVQATQDLIKEYADHGIELNGEDALTFVTIANITHLEKTNPELLSKVLGNSPDAEATLTKVGHIIGQVVTLEVTTKDEQADWTIALLDETDKKIASHNIANVIEGSKALAANQEMTNKEKSEAIQTLIQTSYVKPNFDKTVGYDFTDGTHTSLSQEDGADFITDAVITGFVMGDNEIKNYVYGSETFKDVQAISWNEDVTSNVMRMIEECQNVDVQENTNSYSK